MRCDPALSIIITQANEPVEQLAEPSGHCGIRVAKSGSAK